MALDSNGWLTRDERKSNAPGPTALYLADRRHPESALLDSPKSSILTQTET